MLTGGVPACAAWLACGALLAGAANAAALAPGAGSAAPSATGPAAAMPTATMKDQAPADRSVQTQRQEGEAVLALADAALAGKPVPADFRVEWQNEFLKAQRGTFVPFTLTVDLARVSTPSALVYVRAVRQRETPADRKRDRRSSPDPDYAVDAIFPVELRQEPGQIARISRGFSLAPGPYDVYVVVRERLEAAGSAPRATVVKQPLAVPDFWVTDLATSSILVADRLAVLSAPIAAEALAERPYVIGQNDITPAADRHFRRDEELIVVFLVYNPMVTPEKKFDLQVEYHFFRKLAQATPAGRGDAAGGAAAPHPPEQDGEQYFNHTEPQRFTPATAGAPSDPAGGQPIVAGQGIPLAGFEQGDYRLAIKVVDLLSGKSILKDVFFTVGS